MNFVHVSMDLNTDIKTFVPRIPLWRCDKEDSVTPRICVCKTLDEAIGAFPYKKYFINYLMRKKKDVYLNYYNLKSDNYLGGEELKEKVPDVHLTNEHWILGSVSAVPNLIKIKKLQLNGYNKYTNEYYGTVKTLEYENSIEKYDRHEEFIILSKQLFNKFKKVADAKGMKINILEDKHMHLAHPYWGISTKNYRWIKIDVFIPAGVDVSQLWLLNDKQNDFALRKKILFRQGVNEYEELDPYEYEEIKK